jgi:rod shape determining protein RodA
MNSNFDRSLSGEDVLRRRATLLQRLHIDGQLLLILLVLISSGLFVLYSASGKDWGLLIKQAGLSSRSWSRDSLRAGYRWPTSVGSCC